MKARISARHSLVSKMDASQIKRRESGKQGIPVGGSLHNILAYAWPLFMIVARHSKMP